MCHLVPEPALFPGQNKPNNCVCIADGDGVSSLLLSPQVPDLGALHGVALSQEITEPQRT